jgi:hypothetical protein
MPPSDSDLLRIPAQAPAGARRRGWTARRAWVLLAGTSLVLAGLVVSPLPGPGFIILGPMGLGLLATEFAWARYVLVRVNREEAGLREAADRVAVHIPRYFIIPVVVLYWLGIWALAHNGLFEPSLVWAASFPLFLPVAYLALRIAKVRAHRKAARTGPALPPPKRSSKH